MAFVRKSDIEKMFESNPYKRVIPCGKNKTNNKSKVTKRTEQEPTIGKEDNEVLDYYLSEEVM